MTTHDHSRHTINLCNTQAVVSLDQWLCFWGGKSCEFWQFGQNKFSKIKLSGWIRRACLNNTIWSVCMSGGVQLYSCVPACRGEWARLIPGATQLYEWAKVAVELPYPTVCIWTVKVWQSTDGFVSAGVGRSWLIVLFNLFVGCLFSLWGMILYLLSFWFRYILVTVLVKWCWPLLTQT